LQGAGQIDRGLERCRAHFTVCFDCLDRNRYAVQLPRSIGDRVVRMRNVTRGIALTEEDSSIRLNSGAECTAGYFGVGQMGRRSSRAFT